MTILIRAAAALLLLMGLGAPVAAVPQDEERRSTRALSFREGQGARLHVIGLRPLSGALGEADVKRSEGRTRVKLEMQPLPNPQTLGALYTAYVLWAIAPEGRAESLAELPHSRAFDVEVTTSLPSFGLAVTAEPHAAVTRPGPRLLAEAMPRMDDDDVLQVGRVEYETASEVTTATIGPADLTTPLPLLGARRAVELARAAGAAEFAEDELRQAEIKLAALEQLAMGKRKLSRDTETMARDVMLLAEQARAVAAERQEEARTAAQRRAARRAITEAEQEAQRAQAEAERLRAEAEREQERARKAQEEAAALVEAQRRAQEEAAKAQEQIRQAQAEAERERVRAEEALMDKAEMQERLFQSLSAIVETRREARGLIVSLSDVLFDSGRAALKPGAREKLSKLTGILLAYPGSYTIEVEGHTDSVGSHEYNERLSQGRAQSVRSYLEQAGLPAGRFTRVTGLGETRPVADNTTAAGRQMNRRVEIVIAGLDRD